MANGIWYLSQAGELLRIDRFERFYWRYSQVDEKHEVIAARPYGDELEMIVVDVFTAKEIALAFIEFLFDSISSGMHKMSSDSFFNAWQLWCAEDGDEYIGLEASE